MNEIRARVVAQEKGQYQLSNGAEIKPATVCGKFRYAAQTASDYPAVGDYVLAQWPQDAANAVITALLPRSSCFLRKAAGTGKSEQVVAANIDTVFLCMSLNNNFNVRRLERYLSIAYDSGATPVVVLTKRDLCPDADEKIAQVQAVAPGADVVVVSSLAGEYGAVEKYLLPGKTVAFLGSSGVGKSTLINRLAGTDSIATGAVGNGDKGRHTTTRRALFALSNGAFVMDTPGMRELGLWDSDGGIDTAFAEIEELSRGCKYSNCTHTSEPGCAIRSAVENGALSIDRVESYRKLKIENAAAADRSRYQEAKRAKFKEIAKFNKSNRKK